MASTNKTTNYNLSQFIGSDKPTFLGDYNGDMAKIDAQMKLNADSANTANSLASTANETAGTALTNANSAQASADSAQASANSAQGTASNALEKATQNETDISKFNLTDFENFDPSKISASSGTNYLAGLNVATNSDGSIGKIYGILYFNANTTGAYSATIHTNLRPEEQITIAAAGINYASGGFDVVNLTINPNGDVTITTSVVNGNRHNIILFPCLYFMKNFGDIIVNE